MIVDFNLDKIAAVHFDGKRESLVTIGPNDYREFTSARRIVRSSHFTTKRGDLRSVIPNVCKSFAENTPSSEFFVSIQIKEGISCSYKEITDLLHAIQPYSSSDDVSIQWGLAVNAQMGENVRVLILAGIRQG